MLPAISEIFAPRALRAAWDRVRENGGGPGIDGVTLHAFGEHLGANLDDVASEIEAARYVPRPSRLLKVPKPTGGDRSVVVSTVRDRVAQQALHLALAPAFEPHFLDCSYAYRPGRSARKAIERAQNLVADGGVWVARADISQFFDSIDHGILRGRLTDLGLDGELLQLIMSIVMAPVVDGMEISTASSGVPQGLGIATDLANLYLTPFDAVMMTSGHAMVRYADDLLLASVTEEACREAFRAVAQHLAPLKLTLNAEKSGISRAEDGFDYLGYRIEGTRRGPSRKALEALKERLEAAARMHAVLPVSLRLEQLVGVVTGWTQYYESVSGIDSKNPVVLASLALAAARRGDRELSLSYAAEARRLADAGDQDAAALQNSLKELSQASTAPGPLPCGHGLRPVAPVQVPQDARASHAAIPRLRQLLKNQPDFAEGYRQLAEHYAAIAQFGLARQAFERAVALDPDIPDADRERLGLAAIDAAGQSVPELSDEDVDLFLRRFAGRQGSYARQWVDDDGRRGFAPVNGELTRELVRTHLSGAETFGVYVHHKDNRVAFLAIDIDVDKRVLIDTGSDRQRLVALDALAQQDAARVIATGAKLGLSILLEHSGYRGRHCWCFFDEPIPAVAARRLAKVLLEQAGDPPGGLHREIFPGQDRVKEGRLGSLIKLPLGIHGKSGKRCVFLDRDGRSLSDQALALRQVQTVTLDSLRAWLPAIRSPESKSEGVQAGRLEPVRTVARGEAAGLEPPTRPIAQMLVGCHVVGRLVAKAVETRYLPHPERVVLLYTLGHVGDEGRAYLHRVMAQTLNYDYGVTEKYIRKLKPSPISCARVQEVLADRPGHETCRCVFRLTRGSYPSPVLHAFGASRHEKREVAHEGATERTPLNVQVSSSAIATPPTERPDPGETMQGSKSSPATSAAEEPGPCFSGEPAPAEKDAWPSCGQADPVTAENPPGPTAHPGPATIQKPPGGAALDDIANQYLDLIDQRERLRRQIQSTRVILLQAMAKGGLDAVRTPLGLLRRDGGSGSARLVLELD